MANVLLISTYELGHQPFGLASPTAWLNEVGATVTSHDLAIQPLDRESVVQADLIALYLPMHTATRLASRLIPQLKALNPQAHLCCYGLYAPPNEVYLRELGVDTLLGGEFETGLVELYQNLSAADQAVANDVRGQTSTFLGRQQFQVPDRSGLPTLDSYAQLILRDGIKRQVGYTEASRGCKHTCRHCPIVPVYNGRFRIVQPEIVLADIRQQVQAGAQHITFGDPDFFNGPGHAMRIVTALRKEFPDLTFDVTIKIEHLLKHVRYLPELRDGGCLFITSAVESVDDSVLAKLDKGHTRSDFVQATVSLQESGLQMNPTFVAFTPWTTPETYLEMLLAIKRLDLVESVAPIQYAIRLLIPAGSHLLQLPDIQKLVQPFDQAALCYPWSHPDQEMDKLYQRVFSLVGSHQPDRESRSDFFVRIWQTLFATFPELQQEFAKENSWDLAAKPVPRLSESWY